MTLMEKLNEIFCEVFDDEELIIKPEMTSNDIDGWDSLSHINLVIAVESRFNVRFSQKELLSFKNVGDMLRCIEHKL